MKEQRQNELLRLIATYKIRTQEELLSKIQAAGFNATQATVSRDMRELRIIKHKEPDGTSLYAVKSQGFSSRLREIFRQSVLDIIQAQNIVVLKTVPSTASSACAALDELQNDSIAGTIAGDDTAFIATTDNKSAEKLIEQIQNMLILNQFKKD